MSIPSNATGAGNNSSAVNVFQIIFSQALSAPPTLEAWDDATFSTTIKEMFAGTVVNGHIPYLSAVATTNTAPVSNWKPGVIAGGAVANRLLGDTNFVILSTASPTAGGAVKWNLNWEIPSDATVPSINTTNGVLACRFSFAGATPTLTWQFNDFSAGGTDGAPQWTTLSPGSAGNFFRPADAGSTSANVAITKPGSGVVDSAQVWVTNT